MLRDNVMIIVMKSSKVQTLDRHNLNELKYWSVWIENTLPCIYMYYIIIYWCEN